MGLINVALVLTLGIGGPWSSHITAHYRVGKMHEVVEYRRSRGVHLPNSACYIASPTVPIGTRVQVHGLNTGKSLLCYVADTSQPWDWRRHKNNGLIEVGYWEAQVLCGSTKLRNDECPTRMRVMRQ